MSPTETTMKTSLATIICFQQVIPHRNYGKLPPWFPFYDQ